MVTVGCCNGKPSQSLVLEVRCDDKIIYNTIILFSVAKLDIAIIIGTRPEAIKIWPVLIEARRQKLNIALITTNQQEHLLIETLTDLEIEPDFVCAIPNLNGDISLFLAKAIIGLSDLLARLNPRFVFVQGDTGTATAAAIAAHNLQIQVGHIEAGLRSGDLENPWPEEGNRRIIDSISSFLWRPSAEPHQMLLQDQNQFVVGNTSIDALRMCLESNPEPNIETAHYILITLHRRESFGDKMIAALNEIKKLADLTKLDLIFIEHPNPRVREALDYVKIDASNFKVIKPVPYKKFIKLLSKSSLVISDSGGIQEEATALGIPLLVVRDKTERHEVVHNNPGALVGSTAANLSAIALDTLNKTGIKNRVTAIVDTSFGDGFASEKIIKSILQKEYK